MHPSRAFTRLLVSALALQTVLHAHTVALGSSLPPVMDSIALRWDFSDGRNGWGQSTPLEMGVEVDAVGGALRGVVLGSGRVEGAFVDSPQLRVDVSSDDRDFLVLRMRSLGQCALAMVALERNAAEPATDPGDRRERVAFHDPVRIPFALRGGGADTDSSEMYYIPVWKHVTGAVHRVRLHPCVQPSTWSGSVAQTSGQAFQLDWIAFAKAPVIAHVRGCLDKFFDYDYVNTGGGDNQEYSQQQEQQDEVHPVNATSARTNCTQRVAVTNNFLSSFTRECSPLTSVPPPPIATTYNCARWGGEHLVITGKHFGASDAVVTIDGVECLDVVHVVPEVEIHCLLPPASDKWRASPTFPSQVRVQLGSLPGLFDQVPALAYASPISTPLQTPLISNVATHALDVNWKPPSSFWDAMTVSGYRVSWKRCQDAAFLPINAVVVGNVTHTTLIGLEASTGYQVQVAPLTEGGQREVPSSIDLYGRLESELRSDTVAGVPSPASSCVSTPSHDIVFSSFSARLLTNQSALLATPLTPPTRGPSGEIGDQGHFGLYVTGDAHVENANGSVSCCDGFNAANEDPTAACSYVAASTIADAMASGFLNEVTNRSLPTNAPFAAPFPTKPVFDAATLTDETLLDALNQLGAAPVTASCGPTLRLTGSHARLAGSAWYPRRMNVREGFETTFSFRMANPSTRCRFQDRVHSYCRSRGGDGLAFVVQNDHAIALGGGGDAIGYGGIRNALVVEFDSWYNHELLDVYENHVSVHVSSTDDSDDAAETQHHARSLGSTTRIGDLTQGTHQVRIKYSPNMGEDEQEMLFSDAFAASALAGDMFASGAWSSGIGVLAVYVDDLNSPALAVPLRIEHSIELFHGRAWVGFTAATGAVAWQTHDILDWTFDSLRLDVHSIPAIVT